MRSVFIALVLVFVVQGGMSASMSEYPDNIGFWTESPKQLLADRWGTDSKHPDNSGSVRIRVSGAWHS